MGVALFETHFLMVLFLIITVTIVLNGKERKEHNSKGIIRTKYSTSKRYGLANIYCHDKGFTSTQFV